MRALCGSGARGARAVLPRLTRAAIRNSLAPSGGRRRVADSSEPKVTSGGWAINWKGGEPSALENAMWLLDTLGAMSQPQSAKVFQGTEGGQPVTYLVYRYARESDQPREQPDDAGQVQVGDGPAAETAADCGGKVVKSDRGNTDNAWWYLTNTADRDATVSIKRSWRYKDEWRSDTKEHTLFPGEERDVFDFPRNQEPRVDLLFCRLA